MLHCTYVVTTCDINKFVIIARHVIVQCSGRARSTYSRSSRHSLALRQEGRSGERYREKCTSRELLVYVRPRAVLGARRVSAGDLPVGLPSASRLHQGLDESALQGRLGAVAATVIDGETASRCAPRELLVYVRPRAVLGARRVSAAR